MAESRAGVVRGRGLPALAGIGNACIKEGEIWFGIQQQGGRMKKNGFTLIEIMVATALIGLLATLGSLAITKSIRDSRIQRAQTELAMVSAAVLQLAWDTGKWPNGRLRTSGGSTEMWDISLARCGLLETDGSYDNWKGPYYDGAVKDPWKNRYFFDPDYLDDGVMRVVVGSFGPNGSGQNIYDSDNVYVLLDD